MTKPHHNEGATKFLMRSTGETAKKGWHGTKKHAFSIGISAVITGLASTFIPMLEQHWQDEGVQAQIESVKTDAAHALADYKADVMRENEAEKADRIRAEGLLWHEIHLLQSSNSGFITSPPSGEYGLAQSH